MNIYNLSITSPGCTWIKFNTGYIPPIGSYKPTVGIKFYNCYVGDDANLLAHYTGLAFHHSYFYNLTTQNGSDITLQSGGEDASAPIIHDSYINRPYGPCNLGSTYNAKAYIYNSTIIACSLQGTIASISNSTGNSVYAKNCKFEMLTDFTTTGYTAAQTTFEDCVLMHKTKAPITVNSSSQVLLKRSTIVTPVTISNSSYITKIMGSSIEDYNSNIDYFA